MAFTREKKKSKKELLKEKLAEEERKLTDSERQLRAEQRRRAQKKKRKQMIKTAVIVLIVLAVVAFLVWQWFAKNVAETKQPQNIYVVGTRTITNVLSGTGSVQPADTYNVAATVQGDIINAPVIEGSEVQKGDVLYEIDSSDAENSIKNARNSLRTAQMSYEDVLEGYEDLFATSDWTGKVTKLDVEVGDNVSVNQIIGHVRDDSTMLLDVKFFDSDLVGVSVGTSAEVTVLDYYETIPGTVTEIDTVPVVNSNGAVTRNVTIAVNNPGSISPNFTATASVAGNVSAESGTFSYNEDADITAGVSGEIVALGISEGGMITENMEYIRVSSESLDKQLERAAISLDNARTSYNNALEKLDDYKITAPIAGTVIEKNFNLGETIDSQSGNIVAVIYDMSKYTFDMNIDELDITSINVDQTVKITCEAREGSEYVGYVSKISKQGTSQNGVTSYPVTITIEDPLALEELLPGMNVDAEIVVETVENVVAIPVEAVSRGNMVTVIKAEDVEKYGLELKNSGMTMPTGNFAGAQRPAVSADGETRKLENVQIADDEQLPGNSGIPDGEKQDVNIPETDNKGQINNSMAESNGEKAADNIQKAPNGEVLETEKGAPEQAKNIDNKPLIPEQDNASQSVQLPENSELPTEESRSGRPGGQMPGGMTYPGGNVGGNAGANANANGQGSYGTISAEAQSEAVRVTLGVSDDDFVQVTSGLNVGDVIIVQNQTASNGMFGFSGGGMMGGGMMGGGMPGGGMGGARPAGGMGGR